MQRYKVMFETSAAMLPTLIQVVAPEIKLLGVEPLPTLVRGNDLVKGKPPRTMHYLNGKRFKGILGRDLVVKLLAGGPMPPRKLCEGFKLQGFAANSCSPVLSALTKQGAIKYDVATGCYSLARAVK